MIKSVAFFFLLLLCLNGCDEKPGHHALRIADSLANIVPDSAILFLESLKEEMTTAPEATQMYYRLLCIKAKDKAYILHTTDSLILPILNYYIEKDDKRHLPEAYYYSGRVYCDPEAAMKYINQYLLYNDSVAKLENLETIRKMHAIYNYRLREKENDALKTENSRKTQIMTYAIASGLILLLLFLLYWQHSCRKQLLLNAQLEDIKRLKEEQYQKSTLFIEENKKKRIIIQ